MPKTYRYLMYKYYYWSSYLNGEGHHNITIASTSIYGIWILNAVSMFNLIHVFSGVELWSFVEENKLLVITILILGMFLNELLLKKNFNERNIQPFDHESEEQAVLGNYFAIFYTLASFAIMFLSAYLVGVS